MLGALRFPGAMESPGLWHILGTADAGAERVLRALGAPAAFGVLRTLGVPQALGVLGP